MHQKFSHIKSDLLDKLPTPTDLSGLANRVLRLSDQYISRDMTLEQRQSHIWQDPDLCLAYISYFMPLNILRLKSIFYEAQRQSFFSGISTVLDFGSGPGSSEFAAFDSAVSFSKWHFIESATPAIEWHQKLIERFGLPAENIERNWTKDISKLNPENDYDPKMTVAILSYSLNEVATLPRIFFDCEALMILEPSTQHEGRRLQTLRQSLIDLGFFIWAPCTHQKKCPLLEHSTKDWCHNRIHVQLPEQVQLIENHLPIKNQSLTYSYILARRTPPQISQTNRQTNSPQKEVRIIGDTLYERGKIRQAICRGPDREFLSWLTRYGEPDVLERGRLFSLPDNVEIKGNELRMPKPN